MDGRWLHVICRILGERVRLGLRVGPVRACGCSRGHSANRGEAADCPPSFSLSPIPLSPFLHLHDRIREDRPARASEIEVKGLIRAFDVRTGQSAAGVRRVNIGIVFQKERRHRHVGRF